MKKIHITLLALQNMARDIKNRLLQDFDKLLPSTFDNAAVSQLQWDTLHDDPNMLESFIDANDTWHSWLSQAVTALKLVQQALGPQQEFPRVTHWGTCQHYRDISSCD